MPVTQRDAQKLIDEIRRAKVGAHTIARRIDCSAHALDACFLGGLEAVLQHFLRMQGCHDAAAALPGAMNRPPTEAEIAVRSAQLDSLRRSPA